MLVAASHLLAAHLLKSILRALRTSFLDEMIFSVTTRHCSDDQTAENNVKLQVSLNELTFNNTRTIIKCQNFAFLAHARWLLNC